MNAWANSRKTGFAAALMVLAGGAVAQLNDPTRPPAGFVDESGVGGASGAAAGSAVASSAPKPGNDSAAGFFTLQSVVLSKQGPSVAIIGGQYVPVGAKHGRYELHSVTQDSAVLVRGKEKKVLKLTPQVEKREPATHAAKGEEKRPTAAPKKKTGSPS